MRGRLDRLSGYLVGRGLARRPRIMRAGSLVSLLVAIGLFAAAGTLAVTGDSPRKPLPTGTVFSVARTTVPAVTPAPATATPSSKPTSTPSTSTPDAQASATATPEPTPEPTPAPTPEPTPPPNDSPVARLMIPAIKVDAPVSVKGVGRDGMMEDPNSWNDVAYYNFGGKPGYGTGNNTIFAGHVDYYPHRTAVFWDLRKLKPGDQIHIRLKDGTDYRYDVVEMVVYTSDKAPLDQILGETPEESVTLITCDGTFTGGGYNNRLVVRAERQTDQSGG
jgi:sortase A